MVIRKQQGARDVGRVKPLDADNLKGDLVGLGKAFLRVGKRVKTNLTPTTTTVGQAGSDMVTGLLNNLSKTAGTLSERAAAALESSTSGAKPLDVALDFDCPRGYDTAKLTGPIIAAIGAKASELGLEDDNLRATALPGTGYASVVIELDGTPAQLKKLVKAADEAAFKLDTALVSQGPAPGSAVQDSGKEAALQDTLGMDLYLGGLGAPGQAADVAEVQAAISSALDAAGFGADRCTVELTGANSLRIDATGTIDEASEVARIADDVAKGLADVKNVTYDG